MHLLFPSVGMIRYYESNDCNWVVASYRSSILVVIPGLFANTVSYDEIKKKVITQANDYHRVKAYTP